MKIAAIQIAAFFFVALTPYASLIAFPLYVMANLLLGPASILALLVTSRQVGNSLDFPKAGFAHSMFQTWYWSNVALATPCIAVALYCCVPGLQRGDHIVVRRETRELNGGAGRVDLLLGRSKKDANPNKTKTLLAFILFDPNRSYEKTDFSGGDGPEVSATNINLHAPGASTFGYGSIWNRTSDLLEIQGCLISIDGSVEHRITGVILSGFNASALGVWVGGDGCKRARRAEKIRFRGFYMQVLAVSLPGEKARRLHHLYRQG